MEQIPVARDLMGTPARTIHPAMDIHDAIRLLSDRGYSGLVVMDECNHVAGILTEKDCLRVLSVDTYEGHALVCGGTVRDYMSPLKSTLHPEMDLFSVAAAFIATNFTLLPVLQDHRLVGCVHRAALLEAILRLQRDVVERRLADQEWHRIVLENPETKQAVQLIVTDRRPHVLGKSL